MSDVAKVFGLSCFITSELLIFLIHMFAFSEKIQLKVMTITTKKQGKCKFDSYFSNKQNQLFTNDFIL